MLKLILAANGVTQRVKNGTALFDVGNLEKFRLQARGWRRCYAGVASIGVADFNTLFNLNVAKTTNLSEFLETYVI